MSLDFKSIFLMPFRIRLIFVASEAPFEFRLTKKIEFLNHSFAQPSCSSDVQVWRVSFGGADIIGLKISTLEVFDFFRSILSFGSDGPGGLNSCSIFSVFPA